MGNKPRPKMSPAERAKQFMPFDAVKGLREALARKEAELLYTERQELSDEASEALNAVLASLRAGDRVAVTFYEDHRYRTVSDAVRRIRPGGWNIELNSICIPLSDIFTIVREEEA